MDYGQEEAAAVQGQDPRQYLIQTKRFLKDDAGNLTGLEICDIEWVHDNGRFMPKEKEGTARVIPASSPCSRWVSSGPSRRSSKQFALETDARSNVKAEHGKFTTNIPGVFAAGDMRRGQSLVVWAINEGRGAARECDRFLMGVTVHVDHRHLEAAVGLIAGRIRGTHIHGVGAHRKRAAARWIGSRWHGAVHRVRRGHRKRHHRTVGTGGLDDGCGVWQSQHRRCGVESRNLVVDEVSQLRLEHGRGMLLVPKNENPASDSTDP
jgi:hypothetical protein